MHGEPALWFVSDLSLSHAYTHQLLEDASKQLDSHGLSCLEALASPCLKFTLSSGAWSEAQSTFPSAKVTGEDDSAATADEAFG